MNTRAMPYATRRLLRWKRWKPAGPTWLWQWRHSQQLATLRSKLVVR